MTTQERVNEHLAEAKTIFPDNKIIGIFLQGSQNYGLEISTSDVDTKLVVAPSFKDLAMNKQAVSTTHIRENDEHIDLKDFRLMFQTFRKQNVNFIEILFTKFKWENPLYQKEWERLVEEREMIARYNPYKAVKTMKGLAEEKYHAMEHRYPSKIAVIDKYGYDPKQLHHLMRIEDFLTRYLAGEKYEDCLRPREPRYLRLVKAGAFDLESARHVADETIHNIRRIESAYCSLVGKNIDNPAVDELLDDVQYNILKIAMEEELHGY